MSKAILFAKQLKDGEHPNNLTKEKFICTYEIDKLNELARLLMLFLWENSETESELKTYFLKVLTEKNTQLKLKMNLLDLEREGSVKSAKSSQNRLKKLKTDISQQLQGVNPLLPILLKNPVPVDSHGMKIAGQKLPFLLNSFIP